MTVDYPVRTPRLYWFVVAAVGMLALFGAAAVAATLWRGMVSPVLDLAGLGLLVLPALYLASTREYRARGVIRLAPGEVTVPDHRGAPLVFRVPGLRVVATPVRVRLIVAVLPIDFERGVVLELADAFHRRRISTLTLVDPEQRDALLADLERVLRGEPAQGVVPRPPVSPRPKTALEDQLDRELAALD